MGLGVFDTPIVHKYKTMSNAKKNMDNNFFKMLVIDIETVPIVGDMQSLDNEYIEHWRHKVARQLNDPEDLTELAQMFNERAAIFAEFGKIVCIGLGVFDGHEHHQIRLKSLHGHDEKELLMQFFSIVDKMEQQQPVRFCGHNIKEFDLAFICRRAVINGLPLPSCLQLGATKPWQNPHVDTLELWKFGDYKHYITLDLLATCLGVPSSKSDISGKDVAAVYYKDKDLPRIAKYCLKDVFTTALVYLKLTGKAVTDVSPIFVDEN